MSRMAPKSSKIQSQNGKGEKVIGKMSLEEIQDARPYFIKDKYIRDGKKRRPDDPEYDCTTVHVPEKEWRNFTPAMRQYWEIKS